MTTISELRAMPRRDLLQYRLNLIKGFPDGFNEFTIFVIDNILKEKRS